MLDVEIVGPVPPALTADEITRLATRTVATAQITEGHLAIEFVDAPLIASLNEEHRSHAGPTDVLSFPIDGPGPAVAPRELGDVVICPEHTDDLRAAVVHGVLHLLGMDHETDDGEMLALQSELLDQ